MTLKIFIFAFVLILLIFSYITNSESIEQSFYKGMTISCQTWGYEWATPEMKHALHELKSLGVNSFAIHPYARIQEDGSVSFRSGSDPEHISTPLKWARQMDLRVMLKPHLAYWGTKFGWRGDISFANESEWRRFFDQYQIWIVAMAELAEKHQADIFCVGLEYRHSLKYESEWRQIIASVRREYSGKITYAANWDVYRDVVFWDALDYIGIQAYFPLVAQDHPSDMQIRSAWHRIFTQIEEFANQNNREVIFTEIGYNTSLDAAKMPWAPQRSQDMAALEMQERCLRIALEESKNRSRLAGLFLWKWFTATRPFEHHENFNLQRPQVKALIKNVWH